MMHGKIHETEYKNLGYALFQKGAWYLIDLETSKNVGHTSVVGPKYQSEKQLLSSIDDFAKIRGYEKKAEIQLIEAREQIKKLEDMIVESSNQHETFRAKEFKSMTLREKMISLAENRLGNIADFSTSEIKFSLEAAIYYFANHYHTGQHSELYSILSTSEYRPAIYESFETWERSDIFGSLIYKLFVKENF